MCGPATKRSIVPSGSAMSNAMPKSPRSWTSPCSMPSAAHRLMTVDMSSSGPEHEGAHIEAAQVRSARAVVALTQADHEPCSVIGEDDTSNGAVLEELVGQVEVEEVGVPPRAAREVGDRQFDLAHTDDGELHKGQCVKDAAASGL